MRINYSAACVGVFLESLWGMTYSNTTSSSSMKIFKVILEIISIINSFLFFRNSKTYQLFYSDASVLAQTFHAKVRTISSRRRKTIRYLIGKFLRGTAEQAEERPWTLGNVIEIDAWIIDDYYASIFAFLNPFGIIISYICPDITKATVTIILLNAFFCYLILQIKASNADHRIIGQELYKTQSAQIQEKFTKNIFQDYSERVITRKLNYQKNGIPKYGPGTDLKMYYRNMYNMEDESESTDDDYRPMQSPFLRH